MRATLRHPALALAATCSLLLPAKAQQPSSSADTTAKTQGEKLQKRQRKNARKELGYQYGDWLNNEVPWIITPAEREAFLNLGTNEEREQFIEHFWQVR